MVCWKNRNLQRKLIFRHNQMHWYVCLYVNSRKKYILKSWYPFAHIHTHVHITGIFINFCFVCFFMLYSDLPFFFSYTLRRHAIYHEIFLALLCVCKDDCIYGALCQTKWFQSIYTNWSNNGKLTRQHSKSAYSVSLYLLNPTFPFYSLFVRVFMVSFLQQT